MADNNIVPTTTAALSPKDELPSWMHDEQLLERAISVHTMHAEHKTILEIREAHKDPATGQLPSVYQVRTDLKRARELNALILRDSVEDAITDQVESRRRLIAEADYHLHLLRSPKLRYNVASREYEPVSNEDDTEKWSYKEARAAAEILRFKGDQLTKIDELLGIGEGKTQVSVKTSRSSEDTSPSANVTVLQVSGGPVRKPAEEPKVIEGESSPLP